MARDDLTKILAVHSGGRQELELNMAPLLTGGVILGITNFVRERLGLQPAEVS